METITELEQTLLDLDNSEFTKYNLNGQTLIGKVISIYDTDTLTIGTMISDVFVKINVRLDGIDAPELKSKGNNGLESKLCKLGRNWLKREYLNKLVIVECKEMDKYGRLLGIVYDRLNKDICINKLLIENKFVRCYGGDLHKNEWTIDELQEGIDVANSIGIKDE
jgi:endonuclease YncB( thermonuclease family)